jgi:trigger factor
MLNLKKNDLGKNTFQFDITISKNQIEKNYQEIFNLFVKELEIPGFRKGKAPKDIAAKKIEKEKIYQEVAKKIIPEIYQELVKQENLKPLINPKIELLKTKEGEDWQIRISIAQKPKIILPNYKEMIKNIKSEGEKEDIWVPGKSKEKKNYEKTDENKRKLLNQILNMLAKNTKIEISDLIIEAELEKRLTQLLDDIRKIGLTVEAYLKSKNETIESIKNRFRKEIEEIYKLEIALEEIAEKENIVVNQSDIDVILANIKDEKEREEAKKNSYFYASILRRQKTLDFLLSL